MVTPTRSRPRYPPARGGRRRGGPAVRGPPGGAGAKNVIRSWARPRCRGFGRDVPSLRDLVNGSAPNRQVSQTWDRANGGQGANRDMLVIARFGKMLPTSASDRPKRPLMTFAKTLNRL